MRCNLCTDMSDGRGVIVPFDEDHSWFVCARCLKRVEEYITRECKAMLEQARKSGSKL